MDVTRRRLLERGAGATLAGAAAGCLESAALESGEGPVGYAAFFTLADFARAVGDDAFEIENPVPPGAMGHRWDEPQGLREEILISDAFVYLDVEGYQRWATDTARTAKAEGGDTVVIDALEGVDLRAYDEHGDDGDDDHEDGDHDEGEGAHDDGSSDGDHDHGAVDPHYWLDPVRAQASVEAIAAGLSEADPDNATVYEDNAAAYVDRLADLHGRFEDELADREHDVAVVAGHDSYGYLAARYGFEVHSPHGIQPQAEPSDREIADTVALIDDRGIDTVLYDRFASVDGVPRAANVLVEESSATEAVGISTVEGTTEEWNEEGYGYVEQMEEINLPAFERALGARS